MYNISISENNLSNPILKNNINKYSIYQNSKIFNYSIIWSKIYFKFNDIFSNIKKFKEKDKKLKINKKIRVKKRDYFLYKNNSINNR